MQNIVGNARSSCAPCRAANRRKLSWLLALVWVACSAGSALAQLGVKIDQLQKRYPIELDTIGNTGKPVMEDDYECYQIKKQSGITPLRFLVDKQRVVGVMDRGISSKKEDLAFALDMCSAHVLEGKPKAADWQVMYDVAAAFPPVGAAYEWLTPRMASLFSVKTKTYNARTGALISETPWMPVRVFTGQLDVNQEQSIDVCVVYESADRRMYAIAAANARETIHGALSYGHDLECRDFLICLDEVFWDHVLKLTLGEFTDLKTRYEYALPKQLTDAQKKMSQQWRTAIMLRAALDRGSFDVKRVADKLKEICDPPPIELDARGRPIVRTPRTVVPEVRVRFRRLIGQDLQRSKIEIAERRCAALAEIGEADDLAALRPLVIGNPKSQACSRSACRKVAGRLNLADCPPVDAPNAQWQAWLKEVAPPSGSP